MFYIRYVLDIGSSTYGHNFYTGFKQFKTMKIYNHLFETGLGFIILGLIIGLTI